VLAGQCGTKAGGLIGTYAHQRVTGRFSTPGGMHAGRVTAKWENRAW